MKQPKFNFVPERQLQEEWSSYTPAKVSIYYIKTSGACNLIFLAETVRLYDLKDKFIRFYADQEKRTIGWSIIEGDTSMDELGDARKMIVTENGVIVIGITKLLKMIGIKLTKTLSNLEVKSYKSILNANEIFYIEIPREELTIEEIVGQKGEENSNTSTWTRPDIQNQGGKDSSTEGLS